MSENLNTSNVRYSTEIAENVLDFRGQYDWYVSYTKPRQENVAAINLRQQGFLAYLPLYKTFRKPLKNPVSNETVDSNAKLVTYEPMFPRYVFFSPTNARQSLAAVRSTRGVSTLVMFGTQLATVPAEILDVIQDLEQQRNQVQLQAISPFQPGCFVRLRNPAFNGLEGLVQAVSAKRVTLLLHILGRQKAVNVAHDQIEMAS